MVKTLKKGTKNQSSTLLVKHAIHGIEEKKGMDIVRINLKKIPNSASDYFLICEGESRPQVEAIVRSVEETIEKKTGERPWHVEGLQNAEWVLMDYVTLAIHVFRSDIRKHYNLEGLWADAEMKWVSNGNGRIKPPGKKQAKRKSKRKNERRTKKR